MGGFSVAAGRVIISTRVLPTQPGLVGSRPVPAWCWPPSPGPAKPGSSRTHCSGSGW
jgi:hypothetical protein